MEKTDSKQRLAYLQFMRVYRFVTNGLISFLNLYAISHNTQTIRNNQEKMEGKGKVIFDTPLYQKKANPVRFGCKWALLFIQQTNPKRWLPRFFSCTYSVLLDHKWGVKNEFTFVLHFFLFISDSLDFKNYKLVL